MIGKSFLIRFNLILARYGVFSYIYLDLKDVSDSIHTTLKNVEIMRWRG